MPRILRGVAAQCEWIWGILCDRKINVDQPKSATCTIKTKKITISNMHTSTSMITSFRHCMIVIQYNFFLIIQIMHLPFILWIDKCIITSIVELNHFIRTTLICTLLYKTKESLLDEKVTLKIVQQISWMFCCAIKQNLFVTF